MKRDQRLKQNARDLRGNQTPSEVLVWRQLRSRRMKGFKFRRQHPVGPFIPDFCCIDAKFVIELDGESHLEKRERDHERDEWFQEHGYAVIRCWNTDVYENLEGLMDRIWHLCYSRTPPEFRPPGPAPT
jgi:very-short-patch-repair endonuclease